MKILKIIFFLLVLFFTAPLIHAQVEDNSTLVKIETKDGNEFVGTISNEDLEKLVLKVRRRLPPSPPRQQYPVEPDLQVYRPMEKKWPGPQAVR